MKRILAAFIILASATTAQARTATWKDLGQWTVLGDATEKWCIASGIYKSGRALHIARNTGGWNLGISGISVIEGHSYDATIATKYDTLTLVDGNATSNQTVVFVNLTNKMVANLAIAPAIYIEGLGTFGLEGSLKAVYEVTECFKAMTGETL